VLASTEEEWLRIGLMALVSTTATVVAALAAPSTDPRVLDRFFRRVRPPGFWSRTATRCGLDPRRPTARLGFALLQTAVAAASVFFALVGLTRLFVPAPGEPPIVALAYLSAATL